MRRVGVDRFAILTTRLPREPESARRIVGLFQIGAVLYQDSTDHDTTVLAREPCRVRLRIDEANKLYFWAYHRNGGHAPEEPRWSAGLVRYLDDAEVHRILADVARVLENASKKAEVERAMLDAFGREAASPASGYLATRSKGL